MMNNKIYRKSSLEKLSSPEQLEMTTGVVSAKGWLALIGLGLVIAAVLYWGITGSVMVKAQGQGILLEDNDSINTGSEFNAVLYFDIQQGDKIKNGMDVYILPDTQNGQSAERIDGRVITISRQAIPTEGMEESVEVVVALVGENIRLESGQPCSGYVVIGKIKPIDYILKRK